MTTNTNTMSRGDVDPLTLRSVCGQWATGVAVITANGPDGVPAGMAVNSFTSLSLTPPLVLFCAGGQSTTWPKIQTSGRFAINVLSSDQSELAYSFARSSDDKFAGVPLRTTDDGLPSLEGAVARLVCEVESVYPGGDHEIVVGRVLLAEEDPVVTPLLFHRGQVVDAGLAG